jgi:Rrf2 family protein
MLRLTKRVEYGLMALVDLCAASRPLSARDLAGRHELSYPLLANVLKDLAGAGMVASVRGKNGGYRLAKGPAFVNVGDIMAALEGPFQLADCTGEEHTDGCDISGCCNVKWTVRRIHDRISDLLSKITLSDVSAAGNVGAAAAFGPPGAAGEELNKNPLNLEV